MANASAAPDNEQDEPIEITPYDSSWPDNFASERDLLAALLRPWIVGPIEHIGSTAVAGLAAKPIIDIMVGVESLDASRGAIPVAAAARYKYWPYKADSMHWFCKPSASHRTHHLHLVPFEGWLWNARLACRDALRRDPRLAREYADLKCRLARKHRHDRDAYTESKYGFVQAVLASVNVPGRREIS